MYQNTITLFNFHKKTGVWYPSVISGVDLIASKANNATKEGTVNGDTVEIIIHCNKEKAIKTSEGLKSYTGAKAYAVCDNPSNCITFTPECDFIYDGVWPDLSPVIDDDSDSGLYHDMNEIKDGVYMITSAVFYSLLPHFEIGGR